MIVDLRSTGPYDGLLSYMALAPPMTDFCTVSKYSLRHRKCFVRGFIHELFVFDTNNE